MTVAQGFSEFFMGRGIGRKRSFSVKLGSKIRRNRAFLKLLTPLQCVNQMGFVAGFTQELVGYGNGSKDFVLIAVAREHDSYGCGL